MLLHGSSTAPDIYVVPPEEDDTPPWCCYNSHQALAEDDSDSDSIRHAQPSRYTPYFHRSMSAVEGLVLPSRKATAETRSIVDALGDADDYSDHEIDQHPIDADPEDYDGVGFEIEAGYRYPHHHREQSPRPYSPTQEIGNDSDIVEVVKVRRRDARISNASDEFFGPLGNEPNSKSSFRSRATMAFRSLRGAVRPSSKMSSKSKESSKSLSKSNSNPKSAPRSRRKVQPKSRPQDIFSPIENIPQRERPNTPELSRRPSSRLAQMLSLKRRPSNASFIALSTKPSAPSPYSPTPEVHPAANQQSVFATSPRSSSSTQTRRVPSPETGEIPTPTRSFYQRRSEDDEPTPSWRAFATHEIPPRSASPTPTPHPTFRVPSKLQTGRHFSVLNLHKIFHKSDTSSNPPDDTGQAPSTSSAHSTCPSLSSTPTSEWSGRTTPTVDSVPQTPTGLDENEIRRTIVPIPSCSTVGSGVSLGSSLNSGAISSLHSSSTVSSADTVATRGSISFVRKCHPDRACVSTSGSENWGQTDATMFGGSGRTMYNQESSRPSMVGIPSTVSTRTANGSSVTMRDRTSEDSEPTSLVSPPMSEIDMSLRLDFGINLGLGINLSPSQSGGMLSSNGMRKPTPATHSSGSARPRGATNIPRSLSLKNIGSRFGIVKQQAPPVPPLPVSGSAEEADMSIEMKLNSLHFDDLSFDADQFVAP